MSLPPLTLALDLSTRVGWACGRSGGVPAHGVVVLPSGVTGMGGSMAALIDVLADLHDVHGFTAVVMEAPLQRHAGAFAARMQLGLAAGVELWCYRRSVQCREAAVSTIRKHSVGSGRAKKPDVMAWCRSRGWNPTDHNAADALALWFYATERKAA